MPTISRFTAKGTNGLAMMACVEEEGTQRVVRGAEARWYWVKSCVWSRSIGELILWKERSAFCQHIVDSNHVPTRCVAHISIAVQNKSLTICSRRFNAENVGECHVAHIDHRKHAVRLRVAVESLAAMRVKSESGTSRRVLMVTTHRNTNGDAFACALARQGPHTMAGLMELTVYGLPLVISQTSRSPCVLA